MNQECAVFVRRCVKCHQELDRFLICPEGHANALQNEEWEVYDVTHGVIVATTVRFAVKTKRGIKPSSKVIWTAEADERFPTKELHGRNREGYTPDVNGDPLARLNAHRPRPVKAYGRPMSERWADNSGFCPEPGCGRWCRSLDQHHDYFHRQNPTRVAS